jgi:excisionase family DNA binding protein
MTPFTHELPVLLTRDEVAAALKVSRSTVKRWQRQGILRAVVIGGTYRYRAEDISVLIGGRDSDLVDPAGRR